MPAEELGSKYFTRERIRNRLLKRAAEAWNYAESEMDEFDPLVTLLIEACSVEFEKIALEIGKTQNRMLERLAQLMNPDVTMVQPAYGIVQSSSFEPTSTLPTNAQFIIKRSLGSGKEKAASFLYFSPVENTKLVNGRIACMATCREISLIEDGVKKIQLASSSRRSPLQEQTLWIGLELHNSIESLDGLNFFFNWLNEPEAATWYRYLPFAKWALKGQPIQTKPGMTDEKDDNPLRLLEQEFDSTRRREQEVATIFRRQFICITASPALTSFKPLREVYPAPLDQWYNKNDLKELQDPLLWLEIKFPTAVPPEAIDGLICAINCFPVLNRRLNQLVIRLHQNFNIVPLESEGSFLSVNKILNSNGSEIKLIPIGNPDELEVETFTLRYGVNRFNERNAYETLVNLLNLVREESAFFSSLGQDFLSEHVRELNQLLARMESKVKTLNKHESQFPFIVTRAGKEGSNVRIEFWTCMGAAANKIPMGSRLSAYQGNVMKNDDAYLMTTTTGGQDNLADAEKLVQYKKVLLTRNRIVTLEDLRAAVYAELGQKLRSVNFEKIFRKSNAPGEGFIRAVLITITPDEYNSVGVEWDDELYRLNILLSRQSANNIPYEIRLNK